MAIGVDGTNDMPWGNLTNQLWLAKRKFFFARMDREAREQAAAEPQALRQQNGQGDTRLCTPNLPPVESQLAQQEFTDVMPKDRAVRVKQGTFCVSNNHGMPKQLLARVIDALKTQRRDHTDTHVGSGTGIRGGRDWMQLEGRAAHLLGTIDDVDDDGARANRRFVAALYKALAQFSRECLAVRRQNHPDTSDNAMVSLIKSAFHNEDGNVDQEEGCGIKMSSKHEDRGEFHQGARGLMGHGAMGPEHLRCLEFFNARHKRSEFGSPADQDSQIAKIDFGRKFSFLFQGWVRHHSQSPSDSKVYHRGSSRGMCLTTMYTFNFDPSREEVAQIIIWSDWFLHQVEVLAKQYFEK